MVMKFGNYNFKMDIKELRQQIDKLDETLIRTLAERMKLIPQVAEYKKLNHLPQMQAEREKEIIFTRRKLAENLNLNPDLVEKLVKEIILDAHRIEKEIIDGD